MASRTPAETLPAVWGLIDLLLKIALVAGAFFGLTGHRVGAWVMLGAVIGFLLSHLAIGLISYQRTMSRPWPKVRPLVDDDD